VLAGGALLAAVSIRASDQPAPLPVPEAFHWQETAGAIVALRPTAEHTYRALFSATAGADKPHGLCPAILMAGTELNVLTANGVPASHIAFALDFHGPAAVDALLDQEHYRQKFHCDNPNLKPLAELKAAGVQLYVCSQLLLAIGVPHTSLTRDVTLASDGLVVMMTFENDGYALLPF